MKPDHVYLGQIVSQNLRRTAQAMRFHILTVPLCELLEHGPTWDTTYRAGAAGRSWESLEGAKDCAERTVSRGLDAAVLIVACADGPKVAWAADPHHGPASAVVVEMWVDPRLVPFSPVPTFPGLHSLVKMLADLYPDPTNQESASADPA